MAVSQEELVMHDCQVVCPQCLAVCQYEGGALVARDDSDAPYRHTVTVSAPKTETSRFCHSCGKQLPSGISFCPYCGVDLKAPFGEEEQSAQPQPAPAPKPEPAPEPAPVKKTRPVERAAASAPRQPEREQPRQPSKPVEDNLRHIPRHYKAMHPQMNSYDAKPGTLFKIIAYIIIALLLCLLVYFIYAGLSFEPAV